MKIKDDKDLLVFLVKTGIELPRKQDPRQTAFVEATANMKKEMEGWDLQISYDENHPVGFPASFVDLGYLQNVFYQACQHGRNFNKKFIILMLTTLVHRTKSFDIKKIENSYIYEIKFQSKDDYGWYEYKFNVSAVVDPRKR